MRTLSIRVFIALQAHVRTRHASTLRKSILHKDRINHYACAHVGMAQTLQIRARTLLQAFYITHVQHARSQDTACRHRMDTPMNTYRMSVRADYSTYAPHATQRLHRLCVLPIPLAPHAALRIARNVRAPQLMHVRELHACTQNVSAHADYACIAAYRMQPCNERNAASGMYVCTFQDRM
jgi:hypothetical protein